MPVMEFLHTGPVSCTAIAFSMDSWATVTNSWSGHVKDCLECFSIYFTGSFEEFVMTDLSGHVCCCLYYFPWYFLYA